MNDKVPSPYTEHFNDIRVVVLVEKEPCSDHYHQIELTKEQYLKMLRHLEGNFEHRDGGFDVHTTDDVCVSIPDIRPFKE